MSEMRSRYIERDNGEPILIAYYDGADGKTLRIDTQAEGSLKAVARLFEAFSKGGKVERSLRELPQVIFVPPLVDVLLGESKRLEIRVRQKSENEAVCVIWNQPGSDWEDASELLRQMVRSARGGVSGHQYLTDFAANVLVEVAFKE